VSIPKKAARMISRLWFGCDFSHCLAFLARVIMSTDLVEKEDGRIDAIAGLCRMELNFNERP